MTSLGVSNKATVRRGDLKVSLVEYENNEWHKCEDMMFAVVDALLGFGYGPETIRDAFDQVIWEYGWVDDPVDHVKLAGPELKHMEEDSAITQSHEDRMHDMEWAMSERGNF